MMKIKILHKEDGYWLSIDGQKKALINLGVHGEIVTSALEEASRQADGAVRCQVAGCMCDGVYSLCAKHATSR